jgi:hypothetical protein
MAAKPNGSATKRCNIGVTPATCTDQPARKAARQIGGLANRAVQRRI